MDVNSAWPVQGHSPDARVIAGSLDPCWWPCAIQSVRWQLTACVLWMIAHVFGGFGLRLLEHLPIRNFDCVSMSLSVQITSGSPLQSQVCWRAVEAISQLYEFVPGDLSLVA